MDKTLEQILEGESLTIEEDNEEYDFNTKQFIKTKRKIKYTLLKANEYKLLDDKINCSTWILYEVDGNNIVKVLSLSVEWDDVEVYCDYLDLPLAKLEKLIKYCKDKIKN